MKPRLSGASLGLCAVALLGVGLALGLERYNLLVFTLYCLSVIVVTGLNLLIGLTGQISFGHVAFYALGAYCGALLSMAGVPFGIAFVAAGLFSAACGGLLALPALRVSGPYLAMVTIAFSFVVHHGLMEWRSLTGGANGLIGVPMPAFPGVGGETGLALLAVALMVLALVLFRRLTQGPWGKAMQAVKSTETAAQSIGLNPMIVKTWAFALSAGLAGLAGAIFAPLMMFISPSAFPFSQSILYVLAVIVGGAAALFGPLIGSLIVVVLPELLSGVAEYRLLLFSAFLLGVLWVAPRGFIGLLAALLPRGAPGSVPGRVDRQRLEAFLRAPLAASDGLRVSGLGIRFGGVQAAANVDLHAPAGRITSLIGPNGAGKTTVLNLISGFYTPQQGSIHLDGDLSGRSAWAIARAGIARTYQTTQLFADLSVLDNLLIALRGGKLALPWSGESPAHIALAMDLLSFCGYRGDPHRSAAALPHVDRRLVEIARALATRPRVLLLDEPAAGLSETETATLGELLRAIADLGVAVLLVEHDMSLVMSVSDSVLVLDSGEPIASGPPAVVRSHPAVIAAYLGAADYQGRPRAEPWAGSRDATLVVKDLSLDYGAAPVVDGIGFHVDPGECVAILGANGAGKSSIMRALSGLHRPVAGSIILNDQDIQHLDASEIAARGLALVPEGRQVFPELTVRDNLLLGAYGRQARDLEAEIDAVLRRFPRLSERLQAPAGLLSGGEQQMLAIGRALMARPTLLLLDEPSLGLAPAMIRELFEVLAMLRDEGTTLLIVDQMANLALTLADRAYVLETGRIVRHGSARELREDTSLEAAYLGQAGQGEATPETLLP